MHKTMNRSINYIITVLTLISLLMSAGCADDFKSGLNGGEGENVTLMIPNPVLKGTRATDTGLNETLQEGHIRTLWFFAFPIDGTDDANKVATELTPDDDKLTNEYRSYDIKIKAGRYRIYMLANIEGIDADTSEDAIKNATLSYSSEKMPNPTDGLPMACMPQEVKVGDTTPAVVEDGIVTVANGKQTSLWIDLTFLCAKVRYTLLFDKSKNGFSNVFGDNALTFTGLEKASSVRASTSVADETADSGTPFEIKPASSSNWHSGSVRQYPADYDSFVNMDTDPSKNELPALTGEADADKRAYQGTLYLPENLVSAAPTRLTFGAALDNGTTLQYHVDLPPLAKSDAAREPMRRGHFYDIIGRVTTTGDILDITASVADWTLQTLTYQMHGAYFLKVEKTEISVQSGIETLLKYDTDVDAELLTFESPKYNGTDKDLFLFSKVERDGQKYVSVTVNPEIATDSDALFDSYFYINAANLKKRIEVKPVTLKPFLNVDPQEIEINVREYIASGEYSAKIPITFTTNMENVEITGFIDNSSMDSQSLTLDGKNADGKYIYINVNSHVNNLVISGMNGGAFWKTSHTLTLTYTATGNGKTISQKVNIRIIPTRQNYVIHVRPLDNWNYQNGLPHIYVYQSLQLPSSRHDDNKSKPVGYNKDNDVFAALEYSFTGKIAFLGWGISDKNNPNATGSIGGKGFFIFADDPMSWSYEASNASDHYDLNYDFCKTYRETSAKYRCGACNGNYNKAWPGIVMEPEGNGWWRFELTGVATPGKALIMFSTSHGGNGDCRYPGLGADGKTKPGIPLFDFPDRTGWLDLSNGKTQFTNGQSGELRTYRIYWPAGKYAGINLWINGYNNQNPALINSNQSEDFESEGSYLYYEFTVFSDISLGLQGRNGDQYPDINRDLSLSSFSLDESTGTYCYTYLQNGNAYGGKPKN